MTAAVAAEPYWQSERPRWGPVDTLLPAGPARANIVCCLDPAATSWPEAVPELATLDQRALLAALRGQGVSARTLALALASLPGWSRRQAYDLLGAPDDQPQP